MGNVHFVNLACHKMVFGHRSFYSFSPRLVDVELNLVIAQHFMEREKNERTRNTH